MRSLASISDDDIDLPRAALSLASSEYPELDEAAYLEKVDRLSEAGAAFIVTFPPDEKPRALIDFLAGQQGFRGNAEDYYDPRNSFLNEVLDRRVGIPITLAILYIEVGRSAGLDTEGVGFPGRFLVSCEGRFIDPSEGRFTDVEECKYRFEQLFQGKAEFSPAHLAPVGNRLILLRMLANLKRIYLERGELLQALACSEKALALKPDAATELRDRGLIHLALEHFILAAEDMRRFLELAPEDPSAPAIRERLMETLRKIEMLN